MTDRTYGRKRTKHVNSILNLDTLDDDKLLNHSASLILEDGQSECPPDQSIFTQKGSILKIGEIRRLQKQGNLATNFSYQDSLSLPHLGGIKRKNKIMSYVTEIEDEARQDLVVRARVKTAMLPPLDLPKLSETDRKRVKDMFIAPYSRRMLSSK